MWCLWFRIQPKKKEKTFFFTRENPVYEESKRWEWNSPTNVFFFIFKKVSISLTSIIGSCESTLFTRLDKTGQFYKSVDYSNTRRGRLGYIIIPHVRLVYSQRTGIIGKKIVPIIWWFHILLQLYTFTYLLPIIRKLNVI